MLSGRANAGDHSNGAVRPEVYSEALSDAVRKHAEQVLVDPLFRNSQRYSNLLRFIVDRTLKGQLQDLKERVIGVEVFGRAADYDTSVDPTVRVTANEIRKRLINYYSKVGHDSEIRIDIPLGSYVAEFNFAQPTEDKSQAEPVPAETVMKPRVFRRWYVLGPAALVVAAFVVWGGLLFFSPKAPIDRFWAPTLSGSGPLLLCISSAGPESSTAPGGSTASSGSQPLPTGQAADQDINISVGMLDVNAINKIAVYLRRKGKDFNVRASQAISLADLRSGPAVLYGSYHNEWSHLLETNLRFHFREDAGSELRWIEDSSNPESRNWSIQYSIPYEKVASDYALVTRTQDTNTGQWWIGIGGLTGQATLAVNQLLLDPDAMSRLTAGLPSGWEKKNLQMVLEINVIHGSPGVPRVIATNIW